MIEWSIDYKSALGAARLCPFLIAGVLLMVAGFLVVTCQALVSEVADSRSQCEELLGSCELLETPFDQSKFESDVSLLQGKMAACEEVRTCRLETIIVSPPGLLVEATDFGTFEAAD